MVHKTLYKLISLISTLALFFWIFPVYGFASGKSEGGKSDMQRFVEAMHPGWNLGNTFDALGDETSWGNPPTTKELINRIAAQGFKSIRIPITWKHRMEGAPGYKVDPRFLERIREIVDWSLDEGLYVVINLHHDSGWIFNMEAQHDEVLNKFTALWKQIAEYFKDYPNKLIFESINEPRFSDDWNKDTPKYFEMLDELNTSFHRIVRESGSNNSTRPLVLPTLTCSGSHARLNKLHKTIEKLNDRNIIATIHYYGYWPFSVNIAGATKFNRDVENDIVQTFDRAYDTFVSKGIPVLVGEFGLLGFDKSTDSIQHGEILKYFEYLTWYAKEKNLTLMLWDNGQHYDRRKFKWRDEELYNVIMASLKSRSSNAETDSIYIKKDAQIGDVKVKLNLNGNDLVEIKTGDRALEKGKHYDINGDVLTIKADLLQDLLTKEYGVNAVLTCKFSAGADWKINVICYDTPKLKNSQGTVSSLLIPVEFNGDNLAAMEAVYKGGGNAGPNDWTSFKEFNKDFSPLYDTNQIKLTSDFLSNVRDGELLLKMHFWSGEIVEYSLVKNGTSVIGISPNDNDTKKDNTPLGSDENKNDSSSDLERYIKVDDASQGKTQQNETNAGKTGNFQNNLIWAIIAVAVLILAGTGIYIWVRVR